MNRTAASVSALTLSFVSETNFYGCEPIPTAITDVVGVIVVKGADP